MQSKRAPTALDLLEDIWVLAWAAQALANLIFLVTALGLGLREDGAQVEGLLEQV